MLGLAAELKAAGRTLADRLDEIATRYGVYVTDQLAVRVADLGMIAAAMARLRANPPRELDGEPVTVVDLASGTAELPPTDAVLITGQSVKVVVRPSGTEPKLKCYLEARRPPDSSIPITQERRRARARLARIRGEMSVVLGFGPD